MTKLRKMLIGAFALIASSAFTSVASADSSNLAGPFVGAQGTVFGTEFAGKYVDPQAVNDTTKASVGLVGGVAGFTGGYNIPIGGSVVLTLGASWHDGDAKVQGKELLDGKAATLTISDFTELYIEPTVMINENTGLFVKASEISADVTARGDNVLDQTHQLEGWQAAVGVKSVMDNGIFIKTEAGATLYDDVRISQITDDSEGTTAYAVFETVVAHGAVTIGLVF